MAYEEKIRRLREIVRLLSEGKMPLEDMVALYTEGMELVKECGEILTAYEGKIEEVRQAYQQKDEQ
ncbi:MAG TPA: exodeoxyribonuclease VII small subunit [Clostridiales bacterium]|jgi:exodeoxyribonuclease VII small subunit|nr:exodeoxyribonuclease VII small subunit [Clostridiales bacterium]